MVEVWTLTKCRAEQQRKIKSCLFSILSQIINSEWGQVSINIRQQDHSKTGSMYCVIKCILQGNQARVKNADLRHPSCTVVMYRRKSASPGHNVLIVTTCLSVSSEAEITNMIHVCLFVCLSQIYRVWCLIIISVATFPVLWAVRPAIASVPILASIQGVPESVDSHAYIARWESVHASFI